MKKPQKPSENDNAIWSALNDASRRQMLDLLRVSPMTTSQICEHFEFTRFAVMKHLRLLEDADLVISVKSGRQRINHLNPVPLQEMYRRWIRPFEQLPADRLLRIRKLAASL